MPGTWKPNEAPVRELPRADLELLAWRQACSMRDRDDEDRASGRVPKACNGLAEMMLLSALVEAPVLRNPHSPGAHDHTPVVLNSHGMLYFKRSLFLLNLHSQQRELPPRDMVQHPMQLFWVVRSYVLYIYIYRDMYMSSTITVLI